MGKEYTKIQAESVNIGDIIEVVYREKFGITKCERGTVHHRESYSSGRRSLYTRDGGELYAWTPGIYRPGTIFRIGHKSTRTPETLFEMSNDD